MARLPYQRIIKPQVDTDGPSVKIKMEFEELSDAPQPEIRSTFRWDWIPGRDDPDRTEKSGIGGFTDQNEAEIKLPSRAHLFDASVIGITVTATSFTPENDPQPTYRITFSVRQAEGSTIHTSVRERKIDGGLDAYSQKYLFKLNT